MPDPHGSVAGQAQASALTTALRYDGYGQTIATAPTSLPAEARRWKYQGRLDIAPDGLAAPLYEWSARFYSPGLGTFTQLDPLQGSALDPLTLNRYLYAAANPATLIDPTGLRECEWDSCTGGTADKPDPGNTAGGGGGSSDGGGGSNSTGGGTGGTGNSNSGGGTGGTATGNSTAGGSSPPMPAPGPPPCLPSQCPTNFAFVGGSDRVVDPALVEGCSYIPAPGVGTACSIELAREAAERGDWGTASLEAFGIIPLVKLARGALKWGIKALRGADDAVKIVSKTAPTFTIISGKNLPLPHEIKTGKTLAEHFRVAMVGRTTKGFDAFVDGVKTQFYKSGGSVGGIVDKFKHQASVGEAKRLVIDGQQAGLTRTIALEGIDEAHRKGFTAAAGLREVWVLLPGENYPLVVPLWP
jgi:RHS repeat-associated protein